MMGLLTFRISYLVASTDARSFIMPRSRGPSSLLTPTRMANWAGRIFKVCLTPTNKVELRIARWTTSCGKKSCWRPTRTATEKFHFRNSSAPCETWYAKAGSVRLIEAPAEASVQLRVQVLRRAPSSSWRWVRWRRASDSDAPPERRQTNSSAAWMKIVRAALWKDQVWLGG